MTWKYNGFDRVTFLSRKFGILPLRGPGHDDEGSPQKFQSDFDRNISKAKGYNMLTTPSGRNWVDWKKVMTFFTLLNSPIPSESILGDLRVRLTDLGEK